MINGRCTSNLDDFNKHAWPEVFAVEPRIGSCVKATYSNYRLRVCAVTHCVEPEVNRNFGRSYEVGQKPYIEVELTEDRR